MICPLCVIRAQLFRNHPYTSVGNHKEIAGMYVTRIRSTSIRSMKGRTPFVTSDKGVDVADDSTKRFRPIGGVISANSMLITITTAKWIGSIPIGASSGRMIGSVINMIAITSRNVPRIRKKMLMIIKNCHGFRLAFEIASASCCGPPDDVIQ